MYTRSIIAHYDSCCCFLLYRLLFPKILGHENVIPLLCLGLETVYVNKWYYGIPVLHQVLIMHSAYPLLGSTKLIYVGLLSMLL